MTKREYDRQFKAQTGKKSQFAKERANRKSRKEKKKKKKEKMETKQQKK